MVFLPADRVRDWKTARDTTRRTGGKSLSKTFDGKVVEENVFRLAPSRRDRNVVVSFWGLFPHLRLCGGAACYAGMLYETLNFASSGGGIVSLNFFNS